MTENNNKWIEEAFEKAGRQANNADEISQMISGFLNENTPAILDTWSKIVGSNTAARFAKLVLEHDWFCDAITALQETFLTAGYFLSKYTDKHK